MGEQTDAGTPDEPPQPPRAEGKKLAFMLGVPPKLPGETSRQRARRAVKMWREQLDRTGGGQEEAPDDDLDRGRDDEGLADDDYGGMPSNVATGDLQRQQDEFDARLHAMLSRRDKRPE